MFDEIFDFIKTLYPGQDPIPLHAPVFLGNEKKYLAECIDTTFVSYVGKFVTQFEQMTAEYTGAKYAVAMVNGTTALHIALIASGVKPGEEVITQPLTFVATANAIVHSGARPVFVDVDFDTMGMSPEKLEDFLKSTCELKPEGAINRITGNKIAAIVPMHTFGFPCRIDEIVEVATKYNIPVVEDAAESLGSYYNSKHTGTFGVAGIFSYNGNKTITTGGGGMIITDSEEIAKRAKHLSTTAKVPHPYEFIHDEVGFNYRLPNVNAAIGVAQMEYLDKILQNKRETASKYAHFFRDYGWEFRVESKNSIANYWLNTLQIADQNTRESFLQKASSNSIMSRPTWKLMAELPMFVNAICLDIENSKKLAGLLINLPSSIRN